MWNYDNICNRIQSGVRWAAKERRAIRLKLKALCVNSRIQFLFFSFWLYWKQSNLYIISSHLWVCLPSCLLLMPPPWINDSFMSQILLDAPFTRWFWLFEIFYKHKYTKSVSEVYAAASYNFKIFLSCLWHSYRCCFDTYHILKLPKE